MGRLTVEHFILAHTVRIPIATEADDHESLVFGHDRLVDMPPADKMGEDDGAHVCKVLLRQRCC